MVVAVVSMRMRVDWNGMKTSTDNLAGRTAGSGGVPPSDTDTVKLNKRRFCVFSGRVVEITPVLVERRKVKSLNVRLLQMIALAQVVETSNSVDNIRVRVVPRESYSHPDDST